MIKHGSWLKRCLLRLIKLWKMFFVLNIVSDIQSTVENLGWVFNSRSGRVYVMHLCYYETKVPNLKLKTRPKQLLDYLLLDTALPGSGSLRLSYWFLPFYSNNINILISMLSKKHFFIFVTGVPDK